VRDIAAVLLVFRHGARRSDLPVRHALQGQGRVAPLGRRYLDDVLFVLAR
jgi:hypothetical protein